MASRTPTRSSEVPRKRLVVLLILIVALLASLAIGTFTTKSSKWAPELALDLQGGTQIILTPKTTDGSSISESDVNQAIEIIRQRVDASGVAEAEITSQGGTNIVVGLPGTPSEDTLNLVRTSAVMRMRPVLGYASLTGQLTPAVISGAESSASSAVEGETTVEEQTSGEGDNAVEGDTAQAAGEEASAQATPTVDPSATYDPEELKKIAAQYADANGDGQISAEPATEPTNPSDTNWVTEQMVYESYLVDCADRSTWLGITDDPAKGMVACNAEGTAKYFLGPAEIEGTSLTKASSGWDQQKSQWVVSIEFDSAGTKAFTEVTERLISLSSPQNQFAVVLDSEVISSASPSQIISGGRAQISGPGITQQSSQVLANQLSFGSLPLEFSVQSEEQISATLGSESLRAGLSAGAIGVLLLILYLLWAYQGLGIVAIASIILATGTSYLLVSLLSWTMGYRLSMAGVVGFIISIGITADSFIVFFERIRDEIREGRSLSSSVQRGWQRAKRTIYVADAVNLLCAGVLYFLAVGSVRGFAFTLGLTTILDLVVVVMFTYPVMALLVRRKFFGEGHRFSGMSAAELGHARTYRGRGEFAKAPKMSSAAKKSAAAVAVLEVDEVVEDDEVSAVVAQSPEEIAEAIEAAPETVEATGVDEATDHEPTPSDDPELEGLSLAERKAVLRRRAREADVSDDSANEGGE